MLVTGIEARYTDDIPLKVQGNDVYNIHVERDQQTSRAFIPPKHEVNFEKQATPEKLAYQRAVAAKHKVLPTYMGSLKTLKGNPSTRWSIKMPK